MSDSTRHPSRRLFLAGGVAAVTASATLGRTARAADTKAVTKACIDGSEYGWRPLTGEDFVNVNCHEDTWTWSDNNVHCTGEPLGVTRSVKPYRNFELVCHWRHLQSGGNSGIFVWTTRESLDALTEPGLPKGIEVQILDDGFRTQREARGQTTDWFTTQGDVFPVGVKMEPFPPLSPNGSRSFPSKELTLPSPQWNHYYVRAINGEVRLWVNGEEVSGGTNCQPSEGYLCLESEGAPIDFKNLRIRELP